MAKSLKRVAFITGGRFGNERGGKISHAVLGIQRAVKGIDEDLKACLQTIGDDILVGAIARAPRQLGGLHESGRARVNDKDDSYELNVSFGGPENTVSPTANTGGKNWVDYAAQIHEDYEGNTGEPKFLETAFNEKAAKAISDIKVCVQTAVNKAAGVGNK